MSYGWIKLHRRIKEHWVWTNELYLKAWIAVILTVNQKDQKVLIGGEMMNCGRGQSLLSLEGWVKVFGKKWSIQKVRHFFELLEKDSMIERKGIKYTTWITVCNYDTYQDQQQTDNKLTTDWQQADNRLTTTNKNNKEYKKEKNIKNKIKKEILDFKIIEDCSKKEKEVNRFLKPSIQEIKTYCDERKNNVSPDKFFDFYESKGWKVGNQKMKDWKAAVRTWEKPKENNAPKKETKIDERVKYV